MIIRSRHRNLSLDQNPSIQTPQAGNRRTQSNQPFAPIAKNHLRCIRKWRDRILQHIVRNHTHDHNRAGDITTRCDQHSQNRGDGNGPGGIFNGSGRYRCALQTDKSPQSQSGALRDHIKSRKRRRCYIDGLGEIFGMEEKPSENSDEYKRQQVSRSSSPTERSPLSEFPSG